MADPVVFERDSARLIAEVVRTVQRDPTDLTDDLSPDERHNDTYLVKVDENGVTARAGNVLGTGEATIYYVAKTTPGGVDTYTLTVSVDERTVLNRSMLPIPPNTYVEAKIVGGHLFVTPPPMLLGKAAGAIPVDDSGNVEIWVGAAGSKIGSGMTVMARNNFANVASGAWVALSEDGQEVALHATRCE